MRFILLEQFKDQLAELPCSQRPRLRPVGNLETSTLDQEQHHGQQQAGGQVQLMAG